MYNDKHSCLVAQRILFLKNATTNYTLCLLYNIKKCYVLVIFIWSIICCGYNQRNQGVWSTTNDSRFLTFSTTTNFRLKYSGPNDVHIHSFFCRREQLPTVILFKHLCRPLSAWMCSVHSDDSATPRNSHEIHLQQLQQTQHVSVYLFDAF